MPEAYNRLREFRHAVAVAALESDTDPGRNSTSLIVMTSYGYYSADVSGSRAVTFAASAVYTAHTQHCSTLANRTRQIYGGQNCCIFGLHPTKVQR